VSPARSRLGWRVIAFTFAFFAVGAMHWPIPYDEVELPASLMGPGLALVALAAVIARVFGRVGFLSAIVIVGSAAPAAIVARVVVDTATDPTSHNLWPVELFLGGMVGYTCAAVGAFVATLWGGRP
jgi:hypothetical protein